MRRRQKYKKYVKVQKKLINYFRAPIPLNPPSLLSPPNPPSPLSPLSLLNPPSLLSLPNLFPENFSLILTLYVRYTYPLGRANNNRTITEV